MSKSINFYSEDTDYNPNLQCIDQWIGIILKSCESYQINYIFCSDTYLHQINVEYLNHDTYTDIITFPLEVNASHISSDIFISIDRVRENASNYKVDVQTELIRVMAHGLLHLLGYKDKSTEDQAKMRKAENQAISTYDLLNGNT